MMINPAKTISILALILFLSVSALAYDCSSVQPFHPISTQYVRIFTARFYWRTDGGVEREENEDICSGEVTVPVFDVRGREEEAYYCLKPFPTQVLMCPTVRDGQPVEIVVVPASWIRNWTSAPARDFRFHAYVESPTDPKYLDVFSRTLSFDLTDQHLLVEGAIKAAPNDPLTDGYFVRVEFMK